MRRVLVLKAKPLRQGSSGCVLDLSHGKYKDDIGTQGEHLQMHRMVAKVKMMTHSLFGTGQR